VKVSNANFWAFLTTGNTYGLPSLSLYAPTPKLTFFGFLDALNAAVNPKIASGGNSTIDSN